MTAWRFPGGVQHTKHRPELLRINAQSSVLCASADCAGLTQLLAQPRHGLGLAAYAQERALGIGALFQHRAGGEDLPAQFLRRPGKEELGLDQVPLEERDYRLAQPD